MVTTTRRKGQQTGLTGDEMVRQTQAPLPGVAELEREGAAAVVALEAAGQLHRRHRFIYAAAPDLRVALPCRPSAVSPIAP